ncbi:putative ribonuclease H-like domain-containing protein [Tanacetum coccineum]
MCDKKNSVLFTDTGCIILSHDFKLADESQVLLKVPRKNNMYSVDMKNIVPKESLTCLDETSGILKSFITEIENLVDKNVKIIRCDNETEFKNRVMSEFYEKKCIKKEFSIAQTPQQNSVIEKRNRTLIKATRIMLANSKLLTIFWDEAVNTAFYVHNRVLVVKPHNKTPYELFRGRTPALSFMRPFRCHVTIFNTLDYLGKFDGKSNEGFFAGYSMNSKDFRVYNIRTRKVEENLHIRFLEDKPIIAGDGPKWLFDIDVRTKLINYVPVVTGTNSNDFVGTEESIGAGHSSKETESSQDYILMPLWKDGSLFDSSSKNASNDEPQCSSDAGKKDDEGVNKESGFDDQERSKNITTAPLKATHADFFGDETKVDMSNITTTYPSSVQLRRMTKTTNEQGFISAVYEGKTHKDLYTCLFACFLSQEEPKKVIQALKDPSWIEAMQEELLQFKNKKDERGFEDPEFPDRVYKVEKAIYGLHQAPRAWYETFSTYLLDNGFQRGQIDKTLFIKRVKSDILLVQVYVDDIIFGSTKKELCTEFEKLMHKKFQMSSIASTPMETSNPLMKYENAEDVDVHLYRSMIGSLMYLTSSRPDIMLVVCACARFQVTPKVSHLHSVKRIFRDLKGQPKLGLWYPKDSPFDLEAYTDSDYASASLYRKSTTGGCQFLRSRLISWQCKKQTIVANSTTEAEYVAAASCFKNPVFHSKTKHIEIRHHFIRDSNEKKLIQMIKIHTDQNVADLLTKAFDVGSFQYLIASIGMLNL